MEYLVNLKSFMNGTKTLLKGIKTNKWESDGRTLDSS